MQARIEGVARQGPIVAKGPRVGQPCPAAPAHSRGAEEAPCDESTGNESHYNDLHPGVTETATRPRRVLP